MITKSRSQMSGKIGLVLVCASVSVCMFCFTEKFNPARAHFLLSCKTSPPSPHTGGVLSREALPSCCGHSAGAPLSGGKARPLSRLFSNESRPTPFRALRRACTGHPMPPRHEIAKLPRNCFADMAFNKGEGLRLRGKPFCFLDQIHGRFYLGRW